MHLVVQYRLGNVLKGVMMACTLHASVILCLVRLKGFAEELAELTWPIS